MTAKLTVKRILLVEDDKSEVFLLERMLSEIAPFDYHTTNVPKITDALTLLENETFDVVILDLNLSDIDGLCSLSALHASKVPVIVRSGLDNRKLMDEAIMGGAHQYLVKGEHDGERLKHTLEEAVA